MIKTPRYREREVVAPMTRYVLKEFCNGSPDQNLGPHTVQFDFETMSDFVVDNFRKRINSGEIINNPCHYTRSIRTTIGSGKIENGTVCSSMNSNTGDVTHRLLELGYVPTYPDVVLEQNEARAKLVAIANIDSTPYAFGEDVLELRETARFLRNPVSALYKLGVSFRKSYLQHLKKRRIKIRTAGYHTLAKAHASVYLQYRFALSPLIRSSMDALEAYQSKPPRPSERYSARGIVSNDGTVTEDREESSLLFTYECTRTRTLDEKASILYTVSNPIYDWRYRLGFRLKDVPTTLWQVVPLSFMVDRLLDISSFSKGIINLADPRVTILSACYAYKSSDQLTVEVVDHDNRNYVAYVTRGSKRIDTNFVYDRQPWTPSVSDTIPKLELGNLVDDATKIADLTALTLSLFDPFNRRRD